MVIGQIDVEELRRVAPTLASSASVVHRLTMQVKVSGLDPQHVTTWIKAGVLLPPPKAWLRGDAWLVPVLDYITNARQYIHAVDGDETYASMIAAAGFSADEARAWTPIDRPNMDRLNEMIALRKYVVPEMDESTPPPPAPKVKQFHVKKKPERTWADKLRG